MLKSYPKIQENTSDELLKISRKGCSLFASAFMREQSLEAIRELHKRASYTDRDSQNPKQKPPINHFLEPSFTLRAQDRFAPPVVRQYAIMMDRNGVELAKVQSAHAIADAMAEWQGKNPKLVKIPD